MTRDSSLTADGICRNNRLVENFLAGSVCKDRILNSSDSESISSMLNEINMLLKKEMKNLGWVAEQTLIFFGFQLLFQLTASVILQFSFRWFLNQGNPQKPV
jgi:hypothetical protein